MWKGNKVNVSFNSPLIRGITEDTNIQDIAPTNTIIEPTIDEDLARRAVEAYSFRDYKMGSTTETWKQQVQEAKEKLDTLDFLTQEQKDNILQRYKKKTADWYNKKNSISSQNVSPT